MSKRQRRRYSPEEKAKILRLHLLEQVPISEICEKQRDPSDYVLPVAEGAL
jgi:transposase-like protein